MAQPSNPQELAQASYIGRQRDDQVRRDRQQGVLPRSQASEQNIPTFDHRITGVPNAVPLGDVQLASYNTSAVAGTDGLDPSFKDALERMIAASGGRITIESGFRSNERQAQIFAAAVKKYGSEQAARKWAAPPGKSNHNRGWAADLGGDLELAHRLAPQFGLVFPMSWERWHIEPVWARTRSHEDAYTTPPAGEQNPTKREPQSQDLMAGLSDNLRRVLHGQLPADESANASAYKGGGVDKSTPAGKGALNITQVADVLRGAGFQGQALNTMVAIAMRESGLQPQATGDVKLENQTWGPSVGLFQIRTLKAQHGTGAARDEANLRASLEAQARAAWEISKGGSDFTPWSVYQSHAYLPGLAQVQQELGSG